MRQIEVIPRSVVATCIAALALAGCTNPDQVNSTARAGTGRSPQNGGEPPAPPPPAPASEAPKAVQATPVTALQAFATRYVNWSYRALSSDQRALAAMSVGAARQSERRAAAASRGEATLARARVYNHGRVVSIARELSSPDGWVIVTREQTGGGSEYEGLRPGYHVTLARLARVPGGYAVSQWLPQS